MAVKVNTEDVIYMRVDPADVVPLGEEPPPAAGVGGETPPAAPAPATTAAGVGKSALRGAARETPTGLAALMGFLHGAGGGPHSRMALLGGQEAGEAQRGVDLTRPGRFAGATSGAIAEALPVTAYEPQTPFERKVMAGAHGLTTAAVFSPLMGPLALHPGAQALNLGMGFTGGITAERAAELGYGPVGQTVAGMVGSLTPLVPAKAAMGLGRMMSTRAAVETASTPVVRAHAGRPAIKAAKHMQSLVPEANREEALHHLTQVIDEFPPEARPPTSGALAGHPGGASTERVHRVVGAMDDTYVDQNAARLQAANEVMETKFAEARPRGSAEDVGVRAATKRQQMKDQVKAAWEHLDLSILPEMPLSRLRMTVYSMRQRAGFTGEVNLPTNEVKMVDDVFPKEFGETIPMTEVQSIKHNLHSIQNSISATDTQKMYAGMMLDGIFDYVKDLTAAAHRVGVPGIGRKLTRAQRKTIRQYEKARALNAEYERTWKAKPPAELPATPEQIQAAARYHVTQAFANKAKGLAGRLANPPSGVRPIDVSREIRRRFGGDQPMLDSIEASFWDDMLGPEYVPDVRAARAAARKMKNPAIKNAYVNIYGGSAWRRNKKIVELWHAATTSKPLEPSGAEVIGAMTGPDALREVGRSVKAGIYFGEKAAAARWTEKMIFRLQTMMSGGQMRALLKLGLQDPAVGRDLIRLPVGQDLAKWEERITSYLNRSAVREGVMEYENE